MILKIISWNAYTHFSEAVGKLLCMTSPSKINLIFPDIICLQEITDNLMSSDQQEYDVHLLNNVYFELDNRTTDSFHLRFKNKAFVRALRSTTSTPLDQLPTYTGFVAEQTSYAPKIESHYKNLYILVRQDPTLLQIMDHPYLAMKKCISKNTVKYTHKIVKDQYPQLTTNERDFLVESYYTRNNQPAPGSNPELVFHFLDDHFQNLPSTTVQKLFPQSICEKSEVRSTEPSRSKTPGTSELTFHENLLVRGVLCVLLQYQGHLFMVATIHNIRNHNKMALAKYILFLQQTFQVPYFLVGDTNIKVQDWKRPEGRNLLRDTDSYLALPLTVTSKNSQVIDYAIYSRNSFVIKSVDTVPVTARLSCETAQFQEFVQRSPFARSIFLSSPFGPEEKEKEQVIPPKLVRKKLLRAQSIPSTAHPLTPVKRKAPEEEKEQVTPPKLFRKKLLEAQSIPSTIPSTAHLLTPVKLKAPEEEVVQKTYSGEFVRDHVLLEYVVEVVE
jgi:hypothetical protein